MAVRCDFGSERDFKREETPEEQSEPVNVSLQPIRQGHTNFGRHPSLETHDNAKL
jgi:hypothetical protein